MRELPVEDRADAVGADDEVAVAEVAVHERGLAGGGGHVLGEPTQPELERGMRLVERVEQRAVLVDLGRGVEHRQRRQRVAVDRVDACRDLAALGPRGAGVRRRTRRRAGSAAESSRPSTRSMTKPAPSPSSASEQGENVRDRNAGVFGRGQERVFRRAVLGVDLARRIAPEHEGEHPAVGAARIERPRLPRRAARETAQDPHVDRLARETLDHTRQCDGVGGAATVAHRL